MRINPQVALRVLLAVAVLLVAVFFVSRYVFDAVVIEAEGYTAKQNIEHIQTVIGQDQKGLLNLTREIAADEQSYTFLTSQHWSYKRQYFSQNYFNTENLQFIAFLDHRGELLYARYLNVANGKLLNLPDKLEYKIRHSALASTSLNGMAINGVLVADDTFSTAAVPMYRPDSDAVVSGVLVIGRELTEDFIKAKTNLNVNLTPVRNPNTDKSLDFILNQLTAGEAVASRSVGISSLEVFSLLNDVNDRPVLLVSLFTPHLMSDNSRYGVSTLSIALVVIVLLSSAMIWWLVKYLFEYRIKKLNQDIKHIQVGKDLTTRLVLSGNDELSSVAYEINQMLGTIEKNNDFINARHRQEDAEILLDALPINAYLKDDELRYVTVNQQFCEAVDLEPEDIIGKTDEEIFPESVAMSYRDNEEQVLQTGEAYMSEELEINTGSKTIHLVTHLVPFKDKRGNTVGLVGVKFDVTARKQAEAASELAAKVLENTVEGVMVTDADARIVHVNTAYMDMTGYEEDELIGKVPLLLQSGQSSRLYQEVHRSLEESGTWVGELWSCRKDGATYPEMISLNAIKNNDGDVTNYFSMSTDITEQKEWEQQLYRMAHYDVLTELPNRVLFKDRLHQEIARGLRNNKHVAVLFLDLDFFKSINDSLGHAAGDQLLKIMAERLKTTVRSVDTIARMGGDEFTIMITELASSYQKNMGYLSQVCEKIIEVVTQPADIDGHEINVTASIGVSICPNDADNVDDLLRNADTAMYHAKAQGRRNFQFYSKELNAAAVERLEMEIELRRAIRENQLEIYYQPQVDVISRHVVGAEALLRWSKGGERFIRPDKIVSLAEETGMIYAIGEWVLHTACVQCKQWNDAGMNNLRVAVNLSARQFRQPELVETVDSILKSTGLKPRLLELEVTESAIMEDMDRAIDTMHRLNRLGVRLSLDDFGTGYSSLTYLRRFPIHVLKVDQSFVRDITVNLEDAAIVETIIDLAHRFHLAVIAEGVENEEQLKILSRMNCEQVQGYYFSRPTSFEDFLKYINTEIAV